MDKFKNLLITLTIVAAVGVVIIAATSAVSQGQGNGNQQPRNVNVVNPVASPVPVRDVSVPVPFQRTISDTNGIPDGTFGTGFSINIPEGKFAVVEHVSFIAELPLGQAARALVSCQGTTFTGTAFLRMPFEPQGIYDGMSLLVANSPVRCYAAGNNGISTSVQRNMTTSTTGEISFTVSGYLLDHP
jgi:hypothetical protein